MRARRSWLVATGATAGAIVLVAGMPHAAAVNPASGTTTTSQTLTISIDSPLNGATVPPGNLPVRGRTAFGGLSTATNVLYVVDISGSTGSPDGQDCNGDGTPNAGDDFNGDGSVGDTLDCEISGVIALNNSLPASGVDVGLVPFDSSAAAVDVNPVAAGVQVFTTPAADVNANGVRDIAEAARALTPQGGTDFDDALTAMNAAFATQPAGERNIGFFISDGQASLATGAGSPVEATRAAGTVVNTYSVGSGGAGCAAGSPLLQIATTTGGTCTQVTNPANLSAALGGSILTGIDRVEVRLDGGAPTVATLDALGNWSSSVSPTTVGTHTIAATVVAKDGTRVTADIQINIAGQATTTTLAGGTTTTVAGGPTTTALGATTTTSTTTSTLPAATTTTAATRSGPLARTGSSLLPGLAILGLAGLIAGAIVRSGSPRPAPATSSPGSGPGRSAGRGRPTAFSGPAASPEWGPLEILRALAAAPVAAVLALVDRLRRRRPR